MIEQTVQQLRDMRLNGFVEAFKDQQESTQYSDLAFDERFSLLVDREYIRRKNNRIKRSVKHARLKQAASVDRIDFEANRKLNKAKNYNIASKNRENSNWGGVAILVRKQIPFSILNEEDYGKTEESETTWIGLKGKGRSIALGCTYIAPTKKAEE